MGSEMCIRDSLHAAVCTKYNFRWHGFSEAPNATATEANELPPIAAGGEEIGRRTPAVVIIIPCRMVTAVSLVIDALGVLSKRRQDEVRFAFFWISSRLSDQVGAKPTEAGKMLLLAPSGSETLSNATSQL